MPNIKIKGSEQIQDSSIPEIKLDIANNPTSGKFLKYSAGTLRWETILGGDVSGVILADGTVPLTANWDVGSFVITAAGITIDTLTQGSVVFVGAGGVLSQDNANFFWDDSTNRLGLGTPTPNEQLELTKNLRIPTTTSTTGIIYQGANRLIHTYGSYSIFVGKDAGNFTETGTGFNTGIGQNTLKSQTTGDRNTAIGYNAGAAITTGQYNAFIAYNSGDACTIGSYNVGFGSNTLTNVVDGSYNIAIGTSALANLISGNYNVAIGTTTGRDVTGSSNILIGYYAGYRITSGASNVVFGTFAHQIATTGSYNISIGERAHFSLTTASGNIAIGRYSSYFNETGTGNLCLGYYAGYGVSGNSYSYNTLIGYEAGKALTVGGNNILIGYRTGDNLTTGGTNIVIGYDIDAPAVDSANILTLANLIYATGLTATGTTICTGKVGIAVPAPAAKLHIDQASTTGAMPVLTLDQADVSEEFIRYIGTSANGILTQSIVDAADVASATLVGYVKVYVQDDGNQLTDQFYYQPVYTLA